MASGFGVKGGKGRCFDFWLDFSDCLADAGHPKECQLKKEDYFECLHHRKEFERMNRVELERRKQATGGGGGGGHH